MQKRKFVFAAYVNQTIKGFIMFYLVVLLYCFILALKLIIKPSPSIQQLINMCSIVKFNKNEKSLPTIQIIYRVKTKVRR